MHSNIFRIVLFALVVITGCKKKSNEEPNWSNSMLLDIPSKIRFQQYNRGNLVPNPSFEDRKLIRLDSVHYTYNIAFWKKDINNVKFIDYRTDSLLQYNHVSHGKCAVKISRETSDEYDEKGNGIVSDFIKVLPGMYDLFVDIKCLNIQPYEKRFNKYLSDAVDIRLLYFDKAKQPISPATLHPLLNEKVDNSFKGYSFGRFTNIDSINWCTVKCVSGLYPFNEGIIPDDAKFVKIYIGLKGTGTMYVDNIRFFYSKENLTPKERSTFYFDSLTSPLSLLIPTPKNAVFIDTVKYFEPDSGLFTEPFILVPENMTYQYREAVRVLTNKLIGIFSRSKYKFDIRDIQSGTVIPEKYRGNALIISLGDTKISKGLADKNLLAEIADKDEGFIIDFVVGDQNYIFINAESHAGIYYGAQLATQLFNNFTLTAAKIFSFPDLNTRSVLIENDVIDPDIISIMSKYGINSLFKTGNAFKNEFIGSHPVYYLGKSLNTDLIKGKEVMLIDNQITPGIDNIYHKSVTQGQVIKDIASKTGKVYFLSCFKSNQDIWDHPSLSEIYFNELDEINNLNMIWFGAKNVSHFCDGVQKSYFETNTGKKAIFVNNFQDAKTPSIKMNDYYRSYPEKIPMGSIFDPFDNVELTVNNKDIILKINKTDIFSIFRIATFAEYAWNIRAYDPELSLYKVLVNEFGRETARFMYIYNDAYCGLLTTINKVSNEGVSNRTSRSAENEIASLNIAFDQVLNRMPGRTEITDVLMVMKKMLIEKYVSVYEKAVVNKKIKEDSLYSSIFTLQNDN